MINVRLNHTKPDGKLDPFTIPLNMYDDNITIRSYDTSTPVSASQFDIAVSHENDYRVGCVGLGTTKNDTGQGPKIDQCSSPKITLTVVCQMPARVGKNFS